jgi:DNA-binding XRE family transcriptional regulator
MQQYTLKELRARKNETQEQTANALGISTQTYNAWEKSISNVSISKVNALAKHFGVKLGEIFLN